MPSTPVYAWPYPPPSNRPDVPADMQAALLAVEGSFPQPIRNGLICGTYDPTKPFRVSLGRKVIVTASDSKAGFATGLTQCILAASVMHVGVAGSSGAVHMFVDSASTTSPATLFVWIANAAGAAIGNAASVDVAWIVWGQ